MPNIGVTKKPICLTPNIKKAFNNLKQVFIKALIFQHCNLKGLIQIKTDVLGYAIGKVLSQFNLNFDALPNNLSLNKSDFKTQNNKL